MNQNNQKPGRFLHFLRTVILALLCVAVLLLLTPLLKDFLQKDHHSGGDLPGTDLSGAGEGNGTDSQEVSTEDPMLLLEQERQEVLAESQALATGYFYEDAIRLLKERDDFQEYKPFQDAAASYQQKKDSLVKYEGDISHIFFHSLIADTDKAFDGDSMENGYNYWMTTVSEFKAILQQMYDRGYILVDIHDVAGPVEKDGTTVYERLDLYLPEGKKPFVLSQDDVNYYDYMKNDGFARRIVLDDEGRPACEMIVDGKSVIARDFDVVPLLDVFIEQHPDFSYQGARGILALTGYEGALGYRIGDESNPNLEEDKKTVVLVADALKQEGWTFASHSYSHRHMGTVTDERFIADCKKWKKLIQPVTGDTDVYIFPYGEEIDYSGAKFNYAYEQGFRYFCGVYAYPWIQINKNYVRMTRRNLDGFTMYFYPDRVKDLYDLETVYDSARPVPK